MPTVLTAIPRRRLAKAALAAALAIAAFPLARTAEAAETTDYWLEASGKRDLAIVSGQVIWLNRSVRVTGELANRRDGRCARVRVRAARISRSYYSTESCGKRGRATQFNFLISGNHLGPGGIQGVTVSVGFAGMRDGPQGPRADGRYTFRSSNSDWIPRP
jgi:hypothetical protein